METGNPPTSTPWAPVSRVNQLDAAKLDVEMTAMLKEQLTKVFSLMQPGFLSRYEPELDAFLEFLVWRFSIWVDKPTPGNALMNLRYRDERAFLPMAALGKVRTGLEGPGLTKFQKLAYCLALVGGRYGWARLQMISAFLRWGDSGQPMFIQLFYPSTQLQSALQWLSSSVPSRELSSDSFLSKMFVGDSALYLRVSDALALLYLGFGPVCYESTWRNTTWLWLQKIENIYKAASFVNLLIFLRTGRYRSLIERFLSTRLVYQRPNMNRAVSFEYMNRQLVWHEFSELLLLLLPLLNITSIKKALTFPFSSEQISKSKIKEDACPICEQCPITITYIAHPCQHRYCYYCLRTRCIASSSFRCVMCNEQVLAMQRWHVQEKVK